MVSLRRNRPSIRIAGSFAGVNMAKGKHKLAGQRKKRQPHHSAPVRSEPTHELQPRHELDPEPSKSSRLVKPRKSQSRYFITYVWHLGHYRPLVTLGLFRNPEVC